MAHSHQQRQAWLDIVKLIAMTLVVVYHTPPRFDGAHESALFNMGAPVFFFAAGYLFDINRYRGFASFVRHRARQLLVPYTTFFVIFYALWLLVGRRMGGPEEMSIGRLTPLWQFLQGTPDVVLGTFWFIAALFTMQLIFYPVRRLLPAAGAWVVATLLSLSLLVMPDVPWLRCWNLDKALLYMPIYAIGHVARTWGMSPPAGPRGRRVGLIAALALAAAGLGFLALAPLTINRDVAYCLAPQAVILTVPLYALVSRALERCAALRGVARVVAVTSITYLALQNYLIGVIKIVAARLCGSGVPDHSIALKVAIALLVMAVLYPIALFVDRRLPWLLGKKSSVLGK